MPEAVLHWVAAQLATQVATHSIVIHMQQVCDGGQHACCLLEDAVVRLDVVADQPGRVLDCQANVSQSLCCQEPARSQSCLAYTENHTAARPTHRRACG